MTSENARISIRPATPDDWDKISGLLSAAGLVALDESAQFGPQYAVAEDANGEIVGVAGYERYGSDILLRSVAVTAELRSLGIGAALTADRLDHARANGCSSAYLLTDTARAYWERHGFKAIDRAAAPVGITKSTEWSHACPSSATGMRRPLRTE